MAERTKRTKQKKTKQQAAARKKRREKKTKNESNTAQNKYTYKFSQEQTLTHTYIEEMQHQKQWQRQTGNEGDREQDWTNRRAPG